MTEALLDEKAAERTNRIWGFIGHDYSDKSFTDLSVAFLSFQAFDSETCWPPQKRLPAGFSPSTWLDTGKDPGLGIHQLHREGITGEGVSVAVIDKPIRSTHAELQGRITYTQVFGQDDCGLRDHFHGLACASILAGQSTGVAPSVRLYYFAVPDDGRNFLHYSTAVDRLCELNAALSSSERIRLVSISDGMVGPYEREWDGAKSRLAGEGIGLLYSSREVLSGFSWGGCPPLLDRQDPANYSFSPYPKKVGHRNDAVIIPADFRTTAGGANDGHFAYWGEGGWSWAIPYVAGLCALAWQLRPALRYFEIEELLRQTAHTRPDGSRVLVPAAFIAAVKAA